MKYHWYKKRKKKNVCVIQFRSFATSYSNTYCIQFEMSSLFLFVFFAYKLYLSFVKWMVEFAISKRYGNLILFWVCVFFYSSALSLMVHITRREVSWLDCSLLNAQFFFFSLEACFLHFLVSREVDDPKVHTGYLKYRRSKTQMNEKKIHRQQQKQRQKNQFVGWWRAKRFLGVCLSVNEHVKEGDRERVRERG